uniref:Calcineurin-like phosphoesterase domain-containing protein n=1 Tax=Tetradesmus obliquus TaxID=3088 RepID=A0A383VP43_TETOB|eukprot:jgi/Sobl393_1/18851/SZX66522.1
MGGMLSVLVRSCKSALSRQRTPLVEQRTTPSGNPLPSVVHQVVQQQQLGPGRLLLVGDVHGCLDELQQLLLEVGFKRGIDNLVFVGDLVNKGPKSAEVVSTVRQWCSDPQLHTWAVRGNHDESALKAARLHAQQQPVGAKYHWVGLLEPEDVQFLARLPFSLQVQGYNILVVHAGLVPGVPLQQQELTMLIKMRELLRGPDGSWQGLEKGQEGSQAWAGVWQGPQHVFFGHDAKRRLQDCPYATGLDTGCVYGGQLTACVLPPLADLLAKVNRLDPAGASSSADQPLEPGGNSSSGSKLKSSSTGGFGLGGQGGRGTLPDLGGRLVSVASAVAYEKPGGRKSAENQRTGQWMVLP